MRGTLVFLLLLSGAALAADDTAEAKRLFISGTKHFDLAEYEAALNDFKEGFRKKDDPVFLYNIAQSYRLLKGHEEDSLKFYQTYLRRLPQARNREEVERKIASLNQVIALQDRARAAPPSSTMRPGDPPEPAAVVVEPAVVTPAPTAAVVVVAAPMPERRPVYKRWWLWTAVGGVVVVGLAVGLGVGLSQYNGTAFPKVTF